MFVHPATHHIGRTYTGHNPSVYPTTGRKNLNKENAGAYPTKTPSRTKSVIPSTSLRMGLGVKSAVKDGNVMQSFEGKGKGKEEQIEPKRLFTSNIKTSLPPSKSLGSLQVIQKGTKTPGPVRQNTLRTPAPVPAPTPLPSASRMRRRSRQSLTPIKPVEFKTPAPSGNRWEEEVSMGSIELGVELDEVVEMDEQEMDLEVEYMPPKLPEIPWEPPFELPDVKHAFSVLSTVPPLWTLYEDPVSHMAELDPIDEPVEGIKLCDEDMLEDPMFRRKPTLPVASKPVEKVRIQPSVRSNNSTVARPTAIASRRINSTKPVARPMNTRPTTSKPIVPRTASSVPSRAVTSSSRTTAPGMRAIAPTAASRGRSTVQAPKPKVADTINIALPELDDPVIEDVEFSLDL